MNKQQLAAKIWESANKMRSRIEANEYKDYILGFIFYKFLSDKEVQFLKKNGWTDEYIVDLNENDAESVQMIRQNIGYFISDGFKQVMFLARFMQVSIHEQKSYLSQVHVFKRDQKWKNSRKTTL